MDKAKFSKIDESTLREFAAELKRLTNFPLSDEIVEAAIKTTKPKLVTVTKPNPEMLAAGDTELPIPDDETPEVVIPQAQGEKVTEQAAAEPPKEEKEL